MKTYSSLINGQLVTTDRIHTVINPATGEPCGNITLADVTMAEVALIAAEQASKTQHQSRKLPIFQYEYLFILTPLQKTCRNFSFKLFKNLPVTLK